MNGLAEGAAKHPDAPVVTFVNGDGRDTDTLDAQTLYRQAAAIASRLHAAGFEPGDRALMLYTPSLEFVSALAACLVGGIVPVPICPPDPFNLRRELPRLNAVARDCAPRAILCNRECAQVRDLGLAETPADDPTMSWPQLEWIETDELGTQEPARFDPFRPSRDDLAVLQYTSGSTGDPKGVMITHGNVEHQCDMNRRRLGLGPGARAVLWVPHYHDFGLISGIMNAFAGNGRLYLMSPLSFVARPPVWFDVMSRVGATHTASPNFGYELIVSKSTPEQRRDWDLSALEVAMSAAEPINPETVRRFRGVFAECGLRPSAFCPSYGLAEHTVGVTVGGRAQAWFDKALLESTGEARAVQADAVAAGAARNLVGCGRPVDVDVRIVDPETRRDLGSGRAGEIWVDSPSKALGYYGRPEVSEATFRANLAGDPARWPYLRTGDIGFLHEGELYVSGRISEMIVIRGRNLFPQDIEATVAAAHEQVRRGGVAAFAVQARSSVSEDTVEGLGLLVEVRQDTDTAPESLEAVRRAVERAVTDVHQVAAERVVLCRPRSVVKTTSGKVRRTASRERLESGDLEAAGQVLADRSRAAGPAPPAPTPTPTAEPPADVDPAFEELIATTARQFEAMAGARDTRLFHPVATTLSGRLRVLELLDAEGRALDTATVFAAGAEHPVIVRHANGVTDDDAAWDNRGATARVLRSGRPDALGDGLLDLLLTTGECFSSRSAEDFAEWMAAGRARREEIARDAPHLAAAAWDMFRLPDAYNHVHYHSKVAGHYRTADGRAFFARYRLVDPLHPDGGHLTRDGLLPPDRAGRAPGDQRPPSFLHDRLRREVAESGLRYVLQVQLRPDDGGAALDEVLDATRPWDAEAHPWRDRAELTLTGVVADDLVEALRFNPATAPEELALVRARSGSESASLNHLRSVVYARAGAARTGRPDPAPRARVAVIGAGPAGLTAARALAARGHDVVVLERAPEVGGKARTVVVDGLPFDLGAHLCSLGYHHFHALLAELGRETEPVSEVVLWDLDRGRLEAFGDPALRLEFLRYQQLKQQRFPDVAAPGFGGGAPELDQAAGSFFAEHDLEALGRITSLGYTASGYGFLGDDDVSAHRVLKYAEAATLCMPGERLDFTTPKGGFGPVWQQVADELPDVRTSCEVRAIRHLDDAIVVEAGGERLEVDHLVCACLPQELDGIIDLPPATRELLGRVRCVGYATFVLRARGLPRDGFFLVDDHLRDPATAGHTVAFHHRHPGSDVYLFWAYADIAMSDDELLAPIEEDIARMGGSIEELLAVHRWDYAPHFPRSASLPGDPAQLDAIQGQRDTFWTGGLFNFELVETTMQHAAHVAGLVHRRITGEEEHAGGPAPAAEPAPAAATASPLTTALARAPEADRARIFVEYLIEQLARVLDRPAGTFAPEHHLLDVGLDSVRSVEVFEAIRRDSGIELAPLAIYEHSTVEALARYLARRSGSDAQPAAAGAAPAVPAGAGTVRFDPVRPAFDQLMGAGDHAGRSAIFLGLLRHLTAERAQVEPEAIDAGSAITDWGLDSVTSMEVFDGLMARAQINLPPMVLYEHPTYERLASHLAQEFLLAYPECERPAAPAAGGAAGSREVAALTERLGRMEHVLQEVRDQVSGLTRSMAGPAAVVPYRNGAPAPAGNGGGPAVAPSTPSPWLRVHERPGTPVALRLFCFHSAGLDASMYDVWADALPAGVEVCAVQLPGREPHRREPFERMDELMPAMHAELAGRMDVPFVLFGHSFGALTAYVYTRYLADRGLRLPARLMVASFWAPNRWVCRPELTKMMEGKAPPGLRADQKLMDSWSHRPADALPFPITVFHGAQDIMVPREDVDPWRQHSSASTDVHLVTGGHFQLVTDPLVTAVIGAVLALEVASARAGAGDEAATGPAPEALGADEAAWLRRHDERFAQPADTRGSWNLWDLLHVARVRTSHDGTGEADGPEYPEALDAVLSLLRDDGTFGEWRSPFPYNNFVLAMATLSTLLQWHGTGGRDFERFFEPLDRRILAEDAERNRDDMRGVVLPFGKHFKFPGMFGESLVPAFEADRLLRLGSGVVSPATRALLEGIATEDALGAVERYFRFGDFALPFPECYPDEVVASERVRTWAERAFPDMPGYSAAFAARFYDVTRSPQSKAALDGALARGAIGGLRPAGRLQEVYFSLLYLNKTSVDLATHCPQAMAYMDATQRAYGVGIDERAMDVDVDSTAIAMFVCAKQGVRCKVVDGSRVLERMWDAGRDSYRSSLGYFFNVNMLLLAARATITDPGAGAADRRRMWQRVVEQLDERQWLSVDHISPLYLWESVMSFLFDFEEQFPETPTRHHHDVLDRVLALQDASGGMHSYYFDGPDLEETALGLLALKAAWAGRLEPERRRQVEGALERAQAFLAPRFAERAGHHYPEEWIGNFLFSDPKLTESMLLASLLAEPRARWGPGEAAGAGAAPHSPVEATAVTEPA